MLATANEVGGKRLRESKGYAPVEIFGSTLVILANSASANIMLAIDNMDLCKLLTAIL